MINDVYVQIPVLENDRFILREIYKEKDTKELLKVYSDDKSVSFFNSDNCNGDDFSYKTMEEMEDAIEFWDFSYKHKYFVRWAIELKQKQEVIGTIELFHRRAEDYFDNCAILRLDLRSDYETEADIENILYMIIPKVKELFGSQRIATKAVSSAGRRILALKKAGFCLSEEYLTGHDGIKYDSYYIRKV